MIKILIIDNYPDSFSQNSYKKSAEEFVQKN